jgi:polyisoprenoid-binding protein YceI
MKRQICITMLVAASWAAACKSPEATTEAKAASAEPTKSTAEPAATPKAIDPESVKTLALDPSASKFDFEGAKITKTHHGSFKQFTGAATTIGDELQSLAVEVDTASIEADDPKLTGHLKTPDFLDVAKFPKATFKSSSVTKKAAGSATHEISGALTLHGVTQQITFPATVSVSATAVTGAGEIKIDRQKFSITYPGLPDDLIKDEVVLKPNLVFVKK